MIKEKEGIFGEEKEKILPLNDQFRLPACLDWGCCFMNGGRDVRV